MSKSVAAVLGTALVAVGVAALVGCGSEPETTAEETSAQTVGAVHDGDVVARGQYLVRIGSCNDCHTPWVFDEDLGMPRPDMTRMLSGHPADGPDPEGTPGPHDMGLIGPTFTSFRLPFGVLYSANLTPDTDTGIGSWTEEMFVDIFRKGRHLGGDGRGVLPPMPWFWIRNMTDDDLKAVYAYLQSVPPIRNPVPEHKVPEDVMWALRDGMDRMAAGLPQETWAARAPAEKSGD